MSLLARSLAMMRRESVRIFVFGRRGLPCDSPASQ